MAEQNAKITDEQLKESQKIIKDKVNQMLNQIGFIRCTSISCLKVEFEKS